MDQLNFEFCRFPAEVLMKNSDQSLAVVTGASSGIGYELAKELAQHGYDLVVCSHSSRLEKALQDFKELTPNVEAVRADLATYEGVEYLCNRIKALHGPV